MKINELIGDFKIWTSNAEEALLPNLNEPRLLSSFTESEQFIIETLIRKGLVTKIGQVNPKVIANVYP